jgi:Glycoside hydrolase family 44
MVRVLLLRSRWCSPGPDRAAHGNLDFTDWYLKQIADYYVANGVKLLDYLDVHYYPQASGVSLSDDESAAASARRLRTVKSLYDPTYADESWIDTMGMGPVRLIPRLRGWIDGRFTGAAAAARPKIAISEYNWGNDAGPSSTLAQAEVLAVFGREGVDLATRWVAPEDASKIKDAFLLCLNYDGAGAKVPSSHELLHGHALPRRRYAHDSQRPLRGTCARRRGDAHVRLRRPLRRLGLGSRGVGEPHGDRTNRRRDVAEMEAERPLSGSALHSHL